MDVFAPVLKLVDHNRWTVAGIVIAIAWAVFSLGCQPTTTIDGKDMTATQLQQHAETIVADFTAAYAELDARVKSLDAKREAAAGIIEAGFADLERKIAERQALIGSITGLVQTAASGGVVSPADIIGSVLTIGGVAGVIGFGLDNRRKDRVIGRLKNGEHEPVPA